VFIFGTVIIGFFTDKDLPTGIGGITIALGMLFFLSGWFSCTRSNRRIRSLLEEIEESLEFD
jgi:hypothetical protein